MLALLRDLWAVDEYQIRNSESLSFEYLFYFFAKCFMNTAYWQKPESPSHQTHSAEVFQDYSPI